MKNFMIVKDENGTEIKVEVLFSFGVEEYKKNYIAYTLNDDDLSATATVFISELDSETSKILSIPFEEKEFVLKTYEEVKKMIMED